MLGLGRLEHGGIDLPVNDYVNIDDLMVINILPLKECKQKAQIIVLCPYIFLAAGLDSNHDLRIADMFQYSMFSP